MLEQRLQGYRILIVEDEYFLADDLSQTLSEEGAEIIGPFASVDEALIIAREAPIDAAVLDVNLRGDMVFPVADALRERGIPFIFATGYDEATLPARFVDTPRVEKPFKGDRIAAILGPLVGV
jgi:DNA-binding response OmpR family regulator